MGAVLASAMVRITLCDAIAYRNNSHWAMTKIFRMDIFEMFLNVKCTMFGLNSIKNSTAIMMDLNQYSVTGLITSYSTMANFERMAASPANAAEKIA